MRCPGCGSDNVVCQECDDRRDGGNAIAELRTIRRLFERDDVARNRETHRNGSGVRVFITHKTYARIVAIIAEGGAS